MSADSVYRNRNPGSAYDAKIQSPSSASEMAHDSVRSYHLPPLPGRYSNYREHHDRYRNTDQYRSSGRQQVMSNGRYYNGYDDGFNEWQRGYGRPSQIMYDRYKNGYNASESEFYPRTADFSQYGLYHQQPSHQQRQSKYTSPYRSPAAYKDFDDHNSNRNRRYYDQVSRRFPQDWTTADDVLNRVRSRFSEPISEDGLIRRNSSAYHLSHQDAIKAKFEKEKQEVLDYHIAHHLCSELISEELFRVAPRIARDSVKEVMIEDSINQLFAEEINVLTREIVIEELQTINSERRKLDIDELEASEGEKFLEALCAEHLLSLISKQTQDHTEDFFHDNILNGMIAEILLEQMKSIRAEKKSTMENLVLAEHHRNLTLDIAVDVLLNALAGYSEEDLNDLEEQIIDKQNENCDGESDLGVERLFH